MESNACSGHYRRDLLKFGASEENKVVVKDLTGSDTLQLLVWVIRNFTALINDDPPSFWESMLSRRPMAEYMTASDLAFSVLILEHHMVHWRQLLHFRRETGKSPTKEQFLHSEGLLHWGGIAGELAKKRYDDLCLYFFTNFRSDRSLQGKNNVKKLQAKLDEAATNQSSSLKERIRAYSCENIKPPLVDVENEILHRVFYYSTS